MTARTASGLLLTGGHSRRLGTDKAALLLDGVTLAQRAASCLEAVCDPVFEVGPGFTALAVTREQPPGAGPLAAIVAGGEALRARGWAGPVLVLAVDLPNVTAELLETLRDWDGAGTVVPEAAGRLQPVCARYDPDALAAAANLVAEGIRSLHALLDVVNHDVLDESAWGAVAAGDAFDDVDTAEDAARAGIDVAGLP